MKRALCVLLAVVLIVSMFSGCAGEPGPLRICVDLSYISEDNIEISRVMADMEYALRSTVGIENIEIEYVPEEGTERETALDRIRTEIMSGGGPDVFIIHSGYMDNGITVRKPLFLQPEKSMEIGLFLPLDEYMKDAQYTEWEKLTKVVMGAGRNSEGQQLIPLTYTVPVFLCRAEDFEYSSKAMTWDDMLDSKELRDCAALLGDGHEMKDPLGGKPLNPRLDYLLGRLADYEQEKLLFTEEDLRLLVEQTFDLQEYTEENRLYDTEGWLESDVGVGINTTLDGYRAVGTMNGIDEKDTLSFVPLYSREGGCTAMVLSFAAVNRNTQRPKDAFRVIDYLLKTDRQQDSEMFRHWIYRRHGYGNSMPMHEDVFSADAPVFHGNIYLPDESFASLSKIREQITNVQFAGQLNTVLSDMLLECQNAYYMGKDNSEVIHKAYETMDRILGE